MAFERPKRVIDILDLIRHGELVMPAIQRDYEWDSDRIEWLFDSMMRGYPVSSFLFWDVRGASVESYKFYSFLKDYREDFRIRGEEKSFNRNDRFMAVLDGQQRLTSLYVGFYGSYAWRVSYGRRDQDNETSRPTRRLYLNISKKLNPEDDDRGRVYDFQFKPDLETEKRDLYAASKGDLWFRVGKITDLSKSKELRTYVAEHEIVDDTEDMLWDLQGMLLSDSINYYLETDDDLQKALNIFIRINRGGAQISISTIILSIAISFWKGDAKLAFDRLREEVRNAGFAIDNDFILKAFLYVHSQDIKFNVTNFTRDTAQFLESNWDRLANTISEVFRTIKVFGYNEMQLPSKNVLMPIIYYVYHRDFWEGFAVKTSYAIDREIIRNWLHNAIVHRIVGHSSDTVLMKIRRVFTDEVMDPFKFFGNKGFPGAEIKSALGSAMANSEEFLEDLIHVQKDDKFAFAALAVLFPHLDYRNYFHKDHLHPDSCFRNCSCEGVAEEDREYFSNPYWWNSIVNLQMLDAIDNESKQDRQLEKWVSEEVNERHRDRDQLLARCLIPQGVSLAFKDFPKFAKRRAELLKSKFRELLA